MSLSNSSCTKKKKNGSSDSTNISGISSESSCGNSQQGQHFYNLFSRDTGFRYKYDEELVRSYIRAPPNRTVGQSDRKSEHRKPDCSTVKSTSSSPFSSASSSICSLSSASSPSSSSSVPPAFGASPFSGSSSSVGSTSSSSRKWSPFGSPGGSSKR